MSPAAAAALIATDSPPLAAALAALGDLPAPEPVPAVGMDAGGRLLIVGDIGVASGWAERLSGQREVTVLALADSGVAVHVPDEADFSVEIGNEPGFPDISATLSSNGKALVASVEPPSMWSSILPRRP